MLKKRALSLGTYARSARLRRDAFTHRAKPPSGRRRKRRKRPLDAPRHSSGHGEGPNSLIRPPSHAWRARQDSKSGRRGASGTKRPLGRSAAPTESPLHAPRACPTLRDSLSPHAGIGGNAWGTAPRSKRRPNVGRLQYYETPDSKIFATISMTASLEKQSF